MDTGEFRRLAGLAQRITGNVSRVFVGKEPQVRLIVAGLCSGLHVLIEDVPGVGKTTLARALAASVGLDFGRIQFTPDLLPGDITGLTVWSPEKREFLFKPGAVMHQFLLADEINRASPRTQSALLEAMQEGSVTVDGRTFRLPEPFFVLATQNPVSFLGAFPLPEGELDRFGLSLSLGYPVEDEEVEILSRFQTGDPLRELEPAAAAEEILDVRRRVRGVEVGADVKRFIVRLAAETRTSSQLKLGISPRASQHLMLASQAEAFLNGRGFAIPEDVLAMAPAVLAHRLILSAEARMESRGAREVLSRIQARVPIPIGAGSPRDAGGR
jgi:MoxR-like ATPase